MEDDKLYEKLEEFAAQAQNAREYVLAGQPMICIQQLDQLILNITNFSAGRMVEESHCL